jgi:Trk K+ transport system NAD-binding subunit
LAGLTAGTVGNLLGVRLRKRDTVAILTAQSLGLALGRELRKGGVPVVFLDSNPSGVRQAEEEGFAVVYGDALQETVMQRARFGFVRTVVALTANKTLNSVFAVRARERFGVSNGLVAAAKVGVGLVSEQVGSGQAKIAFEGPHDVERWDVRGRRGDIGVAYLVHTTPEEDEEDGAHWEAISGMSERFVILAVERDGATFVMDGGFTFEEGDRVAVAIHLPERDDALRELADQGWIPAERTETAAEGVDGESTVANSPPIPVEGTSA